MCGLAGFIGFENKELLAGLANEIQAHRGPDHHATWSDDFLSVAHQRLSIIDLSEKGNQPFHKHNLLIIFNGELYNYKELREQLQQKSDVQFISDGDTEVILEYYRHYQEACLSYFLGMFAFAIYDKSTRKLFLARDHFGIKPLFYFRDSSRFAFSSELKTLVSIPGLDHSLNPKSLVSCLNYLWVSGNETMFNDFHKLPPGHYLTINDRHEFQQVAYWTLRDGVKIMAEESATRELTEVVCDSVKRHMVADVPVSAFLSGGLDSSLISVLASRVNQNLSTYTIGISDEDKKAERMPDDQKYARELATLHHFNHHEVQISSKIVDLLPMMVRALDEPIGDPAAINTYLICKDARDRGVKVLLSGMGADEFFAGYRRQKATMLSAKFRSLPASVQKFVKNSVNLLPVRIGKRGLRVTRWAKRFLDFASLPLEKAYMRSYSYYDCEELQKLMKEDHATAIAAVYEEHERIFNSKFNGDPVNQMCYTDSLMFLLGLNLTYSDRASMAASVEVRVPFVDKVMVEYAMTIPGRLKIRKSVSKYILKKVAEQFLPKKIIYRSKASFGAPLRSWISGDLAPMVNELLSLEAVTARGIFNYEYIKLMIDEDRRGVRDHAYRIYQLLTIELWFREFVDKLKNKPEGSAVRSKG